MIRKGRYFVPSMNNYESKDDVLILVTDFGMGRLFGFNIKNQENFEWDELSSGDFEYYYEPATNKDVLDALFPNGIITDRTTAHSKEVTEEWLNSAYIGGK